MGCASSSIRSTSRGTSRGSDRLVWMASSRISRSGFDERAGGTAMTDKQRWLVVALYAAAMAYVEAAVVLYLRTMVDRLDPYQSPPVTLDRKSTRLNSSHDQSSYAVFCLKNKITITIQ